MEIIKFNDVSFSYDEQHTGVLKNINLSFNKGEFCCILGHNGSGKSTLAKMINGLLVPDSGKVVSFGYDTSKEENENPIRRHISMVFQNPDNQIVATIVEDDVAFGPENLGLPRDEIRRRVDEALKIVDMYDCRFCEPHKLSGGQKQRVAIAGAIAMKPDCIVFDEPTAMLDPKGRKEVMTALKNLNENYGIAIILVTHFMDEAVKADRIVVMNKGSVLLDGKPLDIFKNVDKIKKIGLDLPKPLELAIEMKKFGIDFPADVLTMEDFVDEFKKLVRIGEK